MDERSCTGAPTKSAHGSKGDPRDEWVKGGWVKGGWVKGDGSKEDATR